MPWVQQTGSAAAAARDTLLQGRCMLCNANFMTSNIFCPPTECLRRQQQKPDTNMLPARSAVNKPHVFDLLDLR